MKAGAGRSPSGRNRNDPPRLLTRLLALALPDDRRGSSILGDLIEEWHGRPAGLRRTAWYLFEVVGLSTRYLFVRRRLLAGHPGTYGVLDTLRNDLRHAVRLFRKQPVLTFAAAMTLALGIGTSASVFSAIDVILLHPIPYLESARLVSIATTDADRGWTNGPSSWPDFQSWRTGTTTLDLAAYHRTGVNLAGGSLPERLTGFEVSAGFLGVLRAKPALGRAFLPEDEEPGASHVVIVSNAVWRRDFGADPAIVGRSVQLEGEPYEVVGVLPPGFDFTGPVDLLVPLYRTDAGRESRWLGVVGRMRSGSTMQETREEMTGIQARLASSFPDEDLGTSVAVRSLKDTWFPGHFQQGSIIAGVAVLFVLLIACANVANLLLAHGAGREREIALRAALGAGRRRIVVQLLTESLLLAFVGGALGVLLAAGGVRWMRGLTAGVPQFEQIALNAHVVAFVVAAALGSGILFGLAPAIQAVRRDLRVSLSGGGTGGGSRGGVRTRRSLVIAEVALSCMLLISATLLVEAFSALSTKDLGFGIDHHVTAELALPSTTYPKAAQREEFFRELDERVAALPGVTAVGLTSAFPLHGANLTYYTIPNQPSVSPARRPTAVYRIVSPDYFRAMGMQLLAGRGFTSHDVGGAPPVMVVNRKFADLHWPNESPLGKTVQVDSIVWQIVGLVADTYDFGPDRRPPAEFYQPLYQLPVDAATLVVATDQASSASFASLRAALRSLDPDQPLYAAQTVRELLRSWLSRNAAMTEVLGAAGLLAFLLAAVGVYGVMAHTVARRTREVGLRMALGARRRDILRLVLLQGGTMVAIGLGIGLTGSFGTTRFLKFFLYEVSPLDRTAFTGVATVLLLTCLLASLIPALRATRVDPLTALRAE